jgi:hypothetical protein
MASKLLTVATAPVALQTPPANVEVTPLTVFVVSTPAATFDNVNLAVTLALSRSVIAMSVRLSGISSV